MNTRILDIPHMGLMEGYLKCNDEEKYKLCQKILNEAIGLMTVKAERQERIRLMKIIIDNSISMYETLEMYECDILLVDLLEVLNQMEKKFNNE